MDNVFIGLPWRIPVPAQSPIVPYGAFVADGLVAFTPPGGSLENALNQTPFGDGSGWPVELDADLFLALLLNMSSYEVTFSDQDQTTTQAADYPSIAPRSDMRTRWAFFYGEQDDNINNYFYGLETPGNFTVGDDSGNSCRITLGAQAIAYQDNVFAGWGAIVDGFVMDESGDEIEDFASTFKGAVGNVPVGAATFFGKNVTLYSDANGASLPASCDVEVNTSYDS